MVVAEKADFVGYLTVYMNIYTQYSFIYNIHCMHILAFLPSGQPKNRLLPARTSAESTRSRHHKRVWYSQKTGNHTLYEMELLDVYFSQPTFAQSMLLSS